MDKPWYQQVILGRLQSLKLMVWLLDHGLGYFLMMTWSGLALAN